MRGESRRPPRRAPSPNTTAFHVTIKDLAEIIARNSDSWNKMLYFALFPGYLLVRIEFADKAKRAGGAGRAGPGGPFPFPPLNDERRRPSPRG